MSKHEHQLGTFTIETGRMFPSEDGRTRTRRKTGTRTGACVVIIDVERLRYLAGRALSNKGRQATACGGGIVVKVVPASVTEVRLKLNAHGLPEDTPPPVAATDNDVCGGCGALQGEEPHASGCANEQTESGA